MDKTEVFLQLITRAGSGHRDRSQAFPPHNKDDSRKGGDAFITKTVGLQTRISKMKAYLAKGGKDYLNIYGCIHGSASQISDQVDSVIETFIKNYNQATDQWKAEIESSSSMFPAQVVRHRLAVIEMLKKDLNEFGKTFSRLSMVRTKRILDKQQMDRLERTGTLLEFDPAAISKPSFTSAIELETDSQASPLDKMNHTTSFSPPASIKTKRRNIIVALDETADDNSSRKEATTKRNNTILDDICRSTEDSQINTTLTQQELQIFAAENSVIHDEMLSVVDEIKTIGSKVVQIAKLQQLFTEKVMEQEVELERLHETTVRSTENVKEGNELIRDAMKNNASLRAFFLFYILVLGFTILFLDWYNP